MNEAIATSTIFHPADRTLARHNAALLVFFGVNSRDAIVRRKAALATIANLAQDPAPDPNLLNFKLEGPVIAMRPDTFTDYCRQVGFDTNRAIAPIGQKAGRSIPASTIIHEPGWAGIPAHSQSGNQWAIELAS